MKKSDVIRYFGSQTAVAAALNISQAAVSRWGDRVPEARALRLEKLTNGALQADDGAQRDHNANAADAA